VFEQCQTQKFSLSEARIRKTRSRRPRALSDFGKQLIEKQKVRYSYGLSEKQLSNYVKKAMQSPDPSLFLHHALETRLDNVVYRMGVAPTRRAARQIVSHGHILVNGKRTTTPSHIVRAGDAVSVKEGSRNSALFRIGEDEEVRDSAPWVSYSPASFAGTVENAPPPPVDIEFDYAAVFEFYSR